MFEMFLNLSSPDPSELIFLGIRRYFGRTDGKGIVFVEHIDNGVWVSHRKC